MIQIIYSLTRINYFKGFDKLINKIWVDLKEMCLSIQLVKFSLSYLLLEENE